MICHEIKANAGRWACIYQFIIDSDGPICRTASPCSIRGRTRPLMLYQMNSEEKEKVGKNILPDALFDA